jgi:flagellar secretion chaperone FliS
MTAYATAQQTYRESSVLTASPEQLVVMLYDGANRFLLQAAAAGRINDREAMHNRLRRAEAIIEELHSTLDMSQGQVAHRLASIYIFCRRLLNEARLEGSAEKIDQVAGLLAELRESWAQIAT